MRRVQFCTVSHLNKRLLLRGVTRLTDFVKDTLKSDENWEPYDESELK